MLTGRALYACWGSKEHARMHASMPEYVFAGIHLYMHKASSAYCEQQADEVLSPACEVVRELEAAR